MYQITFNPCDDCSYRPSLTGSDNQCKICEFKHMLEQSELATSLTNQAAKENEILKSRIKGYVGMIDSYKSENAELHAELERYEKWVNDLQSGMYVNCVYCGHRYGPADKVPVSMAEALKQHIEQCPKHPMSKLKAELLEKTEQLTRYTTAEAEKKGCEYCKDVSRYKGFGYAEYFHQTAVDEMYEISIDVKFCPNCGRKITREAAAAALKKEKGE